MRTVQEFEFNHLDREVRIPQTAQIVHIGFNKRCLFSAWCEMRDNTHPGPNGRLLKFFSAGAELPEKCIFVGAATSHRGFTYFCYEVFERISNETSPNPGGRLTR